MPRGASVVGKGWGQTADIGICGFLIRRYEINFWLPFRYECEKRERHRDDRPFGDLVKDDGFERRLPSFGRC